MSQASGSHRRARRPAADDTETTGERVRRAKPGQGGKPVGPAGLRTGPRAWQQIGSDPGSNRRPRQSKTTTFDVLVALESVDDLLELTNHFRAHDVDRRVVNGDAPIVPTTPGEQRICAGFVSVLAVVMISPRLVCLVQSCHRFGRAHQARAGTKRPTPFTSCRTP